MNMKKILLSTALVAAMATPVVSMAVCTGAGSICFNNQTSTNFTVTVAGQTGTPLPAGSQTGVPYFLVNTLCAKGGTVNDCAVKFYDNNGNVIGTANVNTSLSSVELTPGTTPLVDAPYAATGFNSDPILTVTISG